jgi:hypothetical protein
MGFERGMIANLGSSMWNTAGNNLSAIPPSTSSVVQNVQTGKLALNYKLGANPWTNPWEGPAIYPVKGPLLLAFVPGWGFEFGGRYVGSWNQFQKNIGFFMATGVTPLTAVSRLTYDDMQNNAGEFFGRIDTPWKLFIKGYLGGGKLTNGHEPDEDFGINNVPPPNLTYAAYTNSLQPVVTGNTFYGVIDGGFDFLLGPTYKVGVFVGYFHFDEKMNAFGCSSIANTICTTNVPTSGLPIITETDHWDALRIGAAGEMMLTPHVKLSADVAYLPWVKFDGVDDHFFGNTGVLASVNPEWGHRGQGVMIDAIASYYFTPQLSIGIGGRYWGVWMNNAAVNRTFEAGSDTVPTPPQFFKANVEQAGAFVQMSYKLGN